MEIIGEDESFPATPEAWTSRIHPHDWQAFRNTRDEIISGKASHFETEYRVRHRDGDGYGSGTKGGTLHRLISSMVEITARKQAEDALRNSEARFRHLAEVQRFGLPGKLTFVNMHFEHIFGHSAEIIVPLAWRKLIHSGRHKRVWPWTKRHGNAFHRFVGHGNWERAPCQTVVCALSRRAGDYPWLRRISRRSFCTY